MGKAKTSPSVRDEKPHAQNKPFFGYFNQLFKIIQINILALLKNNLV